MEKRKFLSKISCILLILFILTGCWDQKEVEKLAYVVAIGVDKAEDNENKIKVTYLIANPEAGITAQGGSQNEPPQETISFVADDFISSKNLANTVVAKQITYDLLRIMFVSEEFARDPDFIKWMYDATKAMEIRRDIKLAVTKENTFTFIQNNEPKLETRPHQYFDMVLERGRETGMSPPSDLNSFFRITEADADLFLGIYGTSEKTKKEQHSKETDEITAGEFQYEGQTNTTQFLGAAVFKEGKMIDSITLEETRLAFILNPTIRARDIITTLPDPFNEEHRIATRLNKNGEVEISMNLKKQTPTINVSVPILIEVLTNHSMVDYPRDKENREKLRKTFEEAITKKMEKFIKKTQEDFGTEPFGWSLIARREFQTIPEYREFDWMKTYPDMDINISVDVRLGKFGRQGELPSLENVRD